MDHLDLRDALRPLARALLPADRERKDATIRSAFDTGGGLKPDALRRSLPPLAFTWYLPGAVTAGVNVGAELTLGGDCRLVQLVVRAKTAPGGGECTVRLTADGVSLETASIAAGQPSGRSPIRDDVARRAAGQVLRLDVVTANGAADVTVMAIYTVAD